MTSTNSKKLLDRIGTGLPKHLRQKVEASKSFFILEKADGIRILLDDLYHAPEIYPEEAKFYLPINKNTIQIIPYNIYSLHSLRSHKLYRVYTYEQLVSFYKNIFISINLFSNDNYIRLYIIGQQRCLFIAETFMRKAVTLQGEVQLSAYVYETANWRTYYTASVREFVKDCATNSSNA